MLRIFQVDSFTNEAFKGNPAGVCILDKTPSDKWMANVAKEMNLSETAFVISKGGSYNLRWFTPETEIDLCGHATLATAHILWDEGYLDKNKEAIFHTKSGILKAKLNSEWIELNFPVIDYNILEVPNKLIDSLFVKPINTGKSKKNYIIELETEEEVKNIKPNFSKMSEVDMHGVVITSKSSGKYDFVSRYFAPGVGVLEDPVTGSIHCVLVKYWHDKLKKDNFLAYQASNRGGELKLNIDGERVIISGKALTVIKGEIIEE